MKTKLAIVSLCLLAPRVHATAPLASRYHVQGSVALKGEPGARGGNGPAGASPSCADAGLTLTGAALSCSDTESIRFTVEGRAAADGSPVTFSPTGPRSLLVTADTGAALIAENVGAGSALHLLASPTALFATTSSASAPSLRFSHASTDPSTHALFADAASTLDFAAQSLALPITVRHTACPDLGTCSTTSVTAPCVAGEIALGGFCRGPNKPFSVAAGVPAGAVATGWQCNSPTSTSAFNASVVCLAVPQ